MDPTAREAFTRVVTDALQEPEGQTQIETVKCMLYRALEKNAFNSERAEELFRMAIERAIWKKLGSVGAATTRSIRGEGIIEGFAKEITEEFKKTTGASDQRQARRGLFSKIIGR
jgi:hypothetical protein